MWNSQSLSSLYERTEHAPELVFEPQTSSFPRMTARCWLYKSEFYWEDEDLPESQIKVLILEMTGHGQRQPLPDDIKIFVWQRDGGRCVKCGSQENLEFDHIIPISMGGSNTARNIQLLCERCNRAKSGNLV